MFECVSVSRSLFSLLLGLLDLISVFLFFFMSIIQEKTVAANKIREQTNEAQLKIKELEHNINKHKKESQDAAAKVHSTHYTVHTPLCFQSPLFSLSLTIDSGFSSVSYSHTHSVGVISSLKCTIIDCSNFILFFTNKIQIGKSVVSIFSIYIVILFCSVCKISDGNNFFYFT